MGRCRKRRHIEKQFEVKFFKPRGIPLAELQGVSVPVDGIEAMRLVDALSLSQEEAAGRMGISAPTLCRILANARSQVARALGSGMAIRIDDSDEPSSDDSGLISRQACRESAGGYSGEASKRTNDQGGSMGFRHGGGRCGGGQTSQKGFGRGCGSRGSGPARSEVQDTADPNELKNLPDNSTAVEIDEQPKQEGGRGGFCGRNG